MHKYANDIYLEVPSNNSCLVQDELDLIEAITANNLRLNCIKSTDVIVRSRRANICLPLPVLGLNI